MSGPNPSSDTTNVLGKVNRLIQDHAEEVGGDGSNYYMAQVREFSRRFF